MTTWLVAMTYLFVYLLSILSLTGLHKKAASSTLNHLGSHVEHRAVGKQSVTTIS